MAVLEYSSLQGGSEAKHKKRTIPRRGALAFLMKSHPGLAKKYNISFALPEKLSQ
jgi:hypothetical protein